MTEPIDRLKDNNGFVETEKLVSDLSLHPKVMTIQNAEELINSWKSKGLLMEIKPGRLKVTQ
jgi:hypothetical protein